MPVRREASRVLTEAFTGTLWFSHGDCQTMPHAEFEQARAAGDALFELVVDHIDWPRVLLEASGRHMSLINAGCHPTAGTGWRDRDAESDFDRPCGGCVREALLTEDRTADWVVAGEPTESPRRRRELGVFTRHLVRAFGYRRDAEPST